MSDSLQAATRSILPVLEEIRNGLRTRPHTSRTAIERLHATLKQASVRPVETAAIAVPASFVPAAAPATASAAPSGIGQIRWTLDSLREAALACVKCPHLVKSRTQVVFGVGNPEADLMFVGEAPGADEDAQGEPFVGKAGQLLTRIITAMGLSREKVYIANVLKCRPDMPPGEPGNRKPRLEEMKTCLPWLEEQIKLIKPRAMVALGATAVEGLLGDTSPMRSLRGRWLDFQGIPVIATYHPAYLLRNQSNTEKRKVWEDMLQVMEKLEMPISEKQRKFFTQSAE